jgi:hypothetical protein
MMVVNYSNRIVTGLLTAFMGLMAYVAYYPYESCHHCEVGARHVRGLRIPIL